MSGSGSTVSSFNEMPTDDGNEILSVNSFHSDLEEFAYGHAKFRSHEHSYIDPAKAWYASDGTIWKINFSAQHNYIDGKYKGDLYSIILSLSKDIDYLSEDFKLALDKIDNSVPPDEDKLVKLRLTHVSQFIIDNSVEIQWSNYKVYTTTEYQGDDESGPTFGERDYHLQEELKVIDSSADYEDPDSSVGIRDIVKNVANISEELIDKYIFDFFESEIQLKRACDIFLSFKRGDESSLDISTMLPKAFLESKR